MDLLYISITILIIILIVLIDVNTLPLISKVNFECSAINTLLRYAIVFQFITLALLIIYRIDEGILGIKHLAYEYLNVLFHLTISVFLNGYLRTVIDNAKKYKRLRRSC